MPWQVYNFALLPLAGAILVGLLITRWRTALGLAGGLFLLYVTLSGASPFDLRPAFPFLTGAVVAALAIAVLLGLRPLAGPLMRILVAVGAAAAVHWTYLAYALGAR